METAEHLRLEAWLSTVFAGLTIADLLVGAYRSDPCRAYTVVSLSCPDDREELQRVRGRLSDAGLLDGDGRVRLNAFEVDRATSSSGAGSTSAERAAQPTDDLGPSYFANARRRATERAVRLFDAAFPPTDAGWLLAHDASPSLRLNVLAESSDQPLGKDEWGSENLRRALGGDAADLTLTTSSVAVTRLPSLRNHRTELLRGRIGAELGGDDPISCWLTWVSDARPLIVQVPDDRAAFVLAGGTSALLDFVGACPDFCSGNW